MKLRFVRASQLSFNHLGVSFCNLVFTHFKVNDLKEQLNERKLQVEELQLQLGKREEELNQAQMRVDEEAASNASLLFPLFT